MHFPKYWARGEWTGTQPSGAVWRQWAWDCSDISPADAKACAELKAQRMGQNAIQRTPQNPDSYPYANRPVREPVLRTLCAAVITRTAYGSEVLNTESLMFIDIDLPPVKSNPGPGLWETLKSLLFGRQGAQPDPVTDPAQAHVAALRRWQEGNPSWTFRVYRTHSGLRYLVTSAWQDPAADPTHAVFASLGCDTRYRQLCKVQKSFRARLTPKPWRCGYDNPPFRFPYEDARREARMNQWIAGYEQASAGFATCQFLATVGLTQPVEGSGPLITEHDTRTKATSGLPLA